VTLRDDNDDDDSLGVRRRRAVLALVNAGAIERASGGRGAGGTAVSGCLGRLSEGEMKEGDGKKGKESASGISALFCRPSKGRKREVLGKVILSEWPPLRLSTNLSHDS
jgi:hypothetical protein